MIDEREVLGEVALPQERDGALGAALLVAMGGVDQHRELVPLRQLHLLGEDALLDGGHVVVADLADGDDAVLFEVARQQRHHALGHHRVVGLLGVEPHRAQVADAELAGAETLPAEQGKEVVLEAAHVGARLADPEGGLDDAGDAGVGHGLVVIGGARAHVDVGIEQLEGELEGGGGGHEALLAGCASRPRSKRWQMCWMSSGTTRPAARRSAA